MIEERRTVRAEGFVPLEAKLRPPVHPPDLVLRGQLVDRLLESTEGLVLIGAAAGFGKTTLVGQWADEDPRPFAWLTVDEGDNAAGVLLTYLLLALNRVEAVDPGILGSVGAAEAPIPAAVLAWLAASVRRRKPFVLVVDEVDHLASRHAVAVLATLATNLPDHAQLVLIGRTLPDLDLAHSAGGVEVLELHEADLRLTRAEVAAMVDAARLRLEPAGVDALLEKTEGWPTGTYLATLSLSSAGSASTGVDSLAGSDRRIGEYLRDQLLANLKPDDQSFLLRVSILERLSGPLCDAVLSTSGSEGRLAQLADSNILVERLPDDPGWFRMHRLFGEALQAELARREPHLVKSLHARASRWLEEHGDVEAAVEHATAAGEVEQAARLIWSAVPLCLAQARLDTLQSWLDSFTLNEIAAHAKLGLTAAALNLQRGGATDVWLASAERGRYEADRPGEPEAVAGAAVLLRAVLARNGAVQMGSDARLAATLLPADDPWQCTAGLVVAISTYLIGSADRARAALEEVENLSRTLGAHQVRMLALTELAVLALDSDDRTRCRPLAEEAESMVREHHLEPLLTVLPLRCLTALLAAESGRSSTAEALMLRCLSRIALAVDPPAWLGVQCRLLLARTALQLGDAAGARTLLSDAQPLLAATPDATALHEAVGRTWREIEKIPLEPRVGASTLTTAELRVLQFLPTHLSFEEIGHRLFISRNTVKTQAVATYRKLGVNSRAEAVERARALGLISR